MEPLESMRYLAYLRPGGALITSTEPVKNIDDYPGIETVLDHLRTLEGAVLVETARLAREAGSPKSGNVVMVGAAADRLPFRPEQLEACISDAFARKGPGVVEANLKAFRAGRGVVQWVSS
jgi:indolepyruvate ferredoxin oxidoreductase beta subunit